MKNTLGQLRVAIADVERVEASLDEQIAEANRLLWRLQEEGEQAGSLSAVRPYSEIEEDEEHARALVRGLRRKKARCGRRLCELRDEKSELEIALARAKAAAAREARESGKRKARVSG